MDPNFHRAAQSGNWEAIQEFPAEFCNQRTASGNTILHVLIQYCDSSADAVKHILTQKPDLAFLKTKDDETPLIIASRRGNLDVVRALIDCVKGYEDGGRRTSGAKRVAKMLLAVANNGNTAFHEAVINNFYDIAEFLVKEDPKIIYGRNNADESPFYIAVKKGYHRIASLILSTCKVYSYDGPDEKTPLHAAAVKNSPECMELILKEIPELTKEVDEFGWTALHYAAKSNHPEMVKLLLSADKSMGYKATKYDDCNTALHIAVIDGHQDVIREILLHCPDCWEMITDEGKNVLHLAVENEQKEVLEFILGNSWASELINKKDDYCNTPLHLYVTTKRLEGSNLVNHPRVDRDVLNNKGLTPLDIISQGSDEVTPRQNSIRDELVHAGATPGLRNVVKRSDTPSIEQENIETYMIVATLLVTVTFAAGFTIPGGYDNSKGNEGMAVLSKKAAFTAFVVSDSLAMLFSTVTLVELFWAKHKWSLLSKSDILLNCKTAISLAIAFLLIAFLTGLYAVLPMRAIRIYLIVVAATTCLPIPVYLVLSMVQGCLEVSDEVSIFDLIV